MLDLTDYSFCCRKILSRNEPRHGGNGTNGYELVDRGGASSEEDDQAENIYNEPYDHYTGERAEYRVTGATSLDTASVTLYEEPHQNKNTEKVQGAATLCTVYNDEYCPVYDDIPSVHDAWPIPHASVIGNIAKATWLIDII